ncbi:MAG: SURF1 family protein [Gammaproteobacteria bacterium]
MRRTFKPRLLPTLIAIAALWLLLSLGFWQLDRADQKQALSRQYQARIDRPVINLNTAGAEKHDKEQMLWRRAVLRGRYDTDTLYLLDNQTLSGRAGNYVYARFILADGDQVLLNRGWVPQQPDRSQAPSFVTPEQELTLTGVIKPPPRVVLLGENVAERLADNIIRVQDLVIEEIAARHNWPLLPYVVRLEPPAPQGFFRAWQTPGFGRDRHLGYAFQWFFLAVALVIIYFLVTIKKQTEDDT